MCQALQELMKDEILLRQIICMHYYVNSYILIYEEVGLGHQ